MKAKEFNEFYKKITHSISRHDISEELSDNSFDQNFYTSVHHIAKLWKILCSQNTSLLQFSDIVLDFLSIYCFDRLLAISSTSMRLDAVGLAIAGIAIEVLDRTDEYSKFFLSEMKGINLAEEC